MLRIPAPPSSFVAMSAASASPVNALESLPRTMKGNTATPGATLAVALSPPLAVDESDLATAGRLPTTASARTVAAIAPAPSRTLARREAVRCGAGVTGTRSGNGFASGSVSGSVTATPAAIAVTSATGSADRAGRRRSVESRDERILRRPHRWILTEPELGLSQRLVHARVTQRDGAVAGALEHLHQLEHDPRVERVERGQALEILRRGDMVATPVGHGGDRAKRLCVSAGEPAALLLHPAVELSLASKVEAIEQRTAVLRDRERRLARVERALEGAHVHLHVRFVQAQVVALRHDRPVAERAPGDVQRIGQAMPRALGVELGPEERDESIARDRRARRRAENRQERETASLGDLSGDRRRSNPITRGGPTA